MYINYHGTDASGASHNRGDEERQESGAEDRRVVRGVVRIRGDDGVCTEHHKDSLSGC